jgi:vitamin B12 transporter
MRKLSLIIGLCLLMYLMCNPSNIAHAGVSEQETKTFLLYFEEKDLVVSPTRSPKPLNTVAENMTVITAREIELMNAHTLADVLSSVVGVQLDFTPSPGIPAPVHIQGSESRQVRVLLDGVTLNNLSDNVPDLGSIPVQNIERVEIIKGPASSVWGSSSGGIINIVTKSPAKQPQETLSASYGERNTSDLRTELSGTRGIAGYYLSLGRLHSGGFRENMASETYDVYAKIALALSGTNIQFTFSRDKGRRGLGEVPEADIDFQNRYMNTAFTLNVTSKISEKMTLNAFANHRRADFVSTINSLTDGTELDRSDFLDKVTGLGTKLTIDTDGDSLVAGVDYSKGTLKSNAIAGGEQGREEWALYSNYTFSIGRLSITPGLRYDHTSTNGDFLSPSLGATFSLTDNTLLRALVSRGFSTPPLSFTFGTGSFLVPNPALAMEKVWSYQAGLETRALKYLLLKGTLFRHDVSDAIVGEEVSGTLQAENRDSIRRQGFELEARTDPVYHTSLTLGFTCNDVTDRKTGDRVPGTAKYSFDFGVLYDDSTTTALLRGHYIDWNVDESFEARNGKAVFDMNVSRTLFKSSVARADVFLALHNIFGTDQFLSNIYRNPSRWLEGGLRIAFL